MGQQKLLVSHGATQWQRASKLLAFALLEVLSLVAILKSCRARCAVKAEFIEHVHHKAVRLAVGGIGGSTVWTIVLLAGPILYAWLTV